MVARTTTGSACPAISGSERARRRRRQIIAALISCTAPAALVADPLPTGGSVAAGDVTISQPSGSRMDDHGFAAMQAVRVLLDGVAALGNPQWGKLHILDGMKPGMRTLNIAKDPECKACGSGG